ncbi:MAG: hypothetical protein JKY65_26830, partial [Planctomycetes bacterium]|nr:hypothetical protein [Planctomycetota bacterium]
MARPHILAPLTLGLLVVVSSGAQAQEKAPVAPPTKPSAASKPAQAKIRAAQQEEKIAALNAQLEEALSTVRAKRTRGEIDRRSARKEMLSAHLRFRRALNAVLAPEQRAARAKASEDRRGDGSSRRGGRGGWGGMPGFGPGARGEGGPGARGERGRGARGGRGRG